MKRIPIFLLLTFFALLNSCKKDVATSNSNPATNSETGDSIYLDKIYYLYDAGSGVDTQTISVFHYDDLKRLTVINNSSVSNDKTIEWSYYYTGTDTIPYKSIYINTDLNFPYYSDTETVYHYFDAGVKIKDSFIVAGSYSEVVNYSYSSGKMYGNRITTDFSSADITYSKDTATFDGNNNIIASTRYTLSGSVYELTGSSHFTYDNFVNPFSKLNIFKSYNKFPNGETLFWEIKCNNNILTQDETSLPGPYNFNLVVSYTYKSNGLPATENRVSGTNVENEIYTYKKL